MSSIPQNVRTNVPDFVIIGAMKAGTSSMHHLLDAHPGVYIPDSEIFFFDLDEFDCHHDFPVAPDGGWIVRDFETGIDEYLPWYQSFFEEADEGMLLGEDSTTYAVSKLAPRRMARLLDEPKLVHMLRNPADRAYSHYWHLIRTSRTSATFEDSLRASPNDYMQYGYYQENLRRYLEYFDRAQLKCVLFERFVNQTQTVVDEVCEFLELDGSVDVDEVESHRNRAEVPRFPGMKRYFNELDPTREAFNYNDHLPDGGVANRRIGPLRRLQRVASDVLDDVAMLAAQRDYPPMDEGTREFLTTAFRRHNPELSSLIGRDVSEWWEGW